ncbi:MAG: hypothetical protein ACI9WU_001779 [Myxococcota bacterium]
MAQWSSRRLSELDSPLVLLPERYDPRRTLSHAGQRLDVFVAEIRESVDPTRLVVPLCYVADTTHAREGVLLPCPLRDPRALESRRKRAQAGDILISRLRPYLRQVALVDAMDAPLLVSPEFLVLRPRQTPAGFLVPYLLSPGVQRVLAASQEGGHHPRVPRDTVAALPIPPELAERRDEVSRTVSAAVVARRAADAQMTTVFAEIGDLIGD